MNDNCYRCEGARPILAFGAAGQNADVQSAAASEGRCGPARVLVIEDNRSDAALIRIALARSLPAPFHCAVAASLAEGMRAAASDRPDLILLDLSLPDSHGMHTLQAVRAALPNTPVIVLTGDAEMQIAVDSLRCGARDFLAKDDLGNLGRTLERVLGEERAEREKRVREAELLRLLKLESVGRLAAGIAHEVNSPLQFVGDNLFFLRKAFQLILPALARARDVEGRAGASAAPTTGLVSDSKFQYMLEQVPAAVEQALDGVNRVARLVATMTEHCRPTSEARIAVDVRRLIETSVWRCRDQWQPLAEVVLEHDADLPLVPGHPEELVDVFTNVLVNAAEAIGRKLGTSKGTIHIRTAERDGWLEVRIRDDGAGVSELHVDRLFDPFFTTKPVGQGAGQGLAIVHAIVVQKHGGRVAVASPSGQGTTFTLSLPLASPAGAT